MRVAMLMMVVFTTNVFAGSSAENTDRAMYRFKNAQGTWEMAQTLSPEAYQAGYQVLVDGQVIDTVSPPPTEAQLKELAVKEQKELERKQQLLEDQKLLKTYSSAEDAIRARDRKIKQAQVITEITASKVKQIKEDTETLVAEAASAQQSGLSVYDSIVSRVRANEQEILRLEKFLENKNQEKKSIMDVHQAIIDRLNYLEQNPIKSDLEQNPI